MKAIDLHKKHGIPTRRIQFYVEKGLVGCVHNPGRGSVGRTFGCDNELELLLVDELSNRCGMELSKIQAAFGVIMESNFLKCRYYKDSPRDNPVFIVYGNSDRSLNVDTFVYLGDLGEEISMPIRTGWSSCVVVNMRALYRRI